ncbi:hypothetical protein E2542_SST22144 [Spatholobus suberectus]|nr:hypothetical protein E2542_SST22144 [Spatholobus suberectus]
MAQSHSLVVSQPSQVPQKAENGVIVILAISGTGTGELLDPFCSGQQKTEAKRWLRVCRGGFRWLCSIVMEGGNLLSKSVCWVRVVVIHDGFGLGVCEFSISQRDDGVVVLVMSHSLRHSDVLSSGSRFDFMELWGLREGEKRGKEGKKGKKEGNTAIKNCLRR